MNRALVAAVAMVLSYGNGTARAAENDGAPANQEVLQTVYVTASKRGEMALQDVPMAIQAIGADDLQRRGIVEFTDYARSISGLSFSDEGPGDKKYVLRGLQSTGAATTGVYFDDIVITGSNRQDGGGRQPDVRLIDMERVEVLKGPQGTLYGASSMSGTIRMITNKPDASEFAASVGAGTSSTRYASGENYDVNGMLNIPLVQDKLAIRLVGYHSDDAGFIDNEFQGVTGNLGKDGINNQVVSGGRVALRWHITDALDLDLMWIRQDTDTDGPAWYQPLYGEFVVVNHTRAPWNEELNAYNMALNWNGEHGTVTATASYMDRDIFFSTPGTRTLCSIFNASSPRCFVPEDPIQYPANSTVNQPQDRSLLTSELRYASRWDSRFQVVGGVFYQQEKSAFLSQVRFTDQLGVPLPAIGPNLQIHRSIDDEIDQTAVFGELSYDFTDKLTATIGIRAFRFDISSIGQNRETRARPVAAAPVHTTTREEDQTYKLNLAYKLSDDLNLYATYAEGYRSGGINEPDSLTGQIFPPFESDSLKSYEIGMKGFALDHKLQFDLAAYRMDWSDLQARVLTPFSAGTFLILDNVGQAQIDGLEAGVQARPISGRDFTVGGNVTLLKPELSANDVQGIGADRGLEGDRIPNVPKVSGGLFAEYGFPLLSSLDAIARVDYSTVGESFTTFRPTSRVYRSIGDYSLVDFRFTVNYGKSLQTTLFATNLLDEHAEVTHFVDANLRRPDQVTPLRPRTIGISLNYNF